MYLYLVLYKQYLNIFFKKNIYLIYFSFNFLLIYRCILEKDPIAQKHAARIQKMRGTYDSMGNRLPPPQPSVTTTTVSRRSKSSGNLSKFRNHYIQK